MVLLSSPPEAGPECPVLATARIVSGKWTLLILRDLAGATCRFSELQRSLAGISPRTLSHRLRALEDEGIIARRVYAGVPPKVEYRLTDKGRDLVPIVQAMRTYGESWLAEPCADAAPARPFEALTG